MTAARFDSISTAPAFTARQLVVFVPRSLVLLVGMAPTAIRH